MNQPCPSKTSTCHTHKEMGIRDIWLFFSLATLEIAKQWRNAFNILRENDYKVKILYSAISQFCVMAEGRHCWTCQNLNILPPLELLSGKGLEVSCKWKLLSCVRLFAIPWTIQSMEFSRPEWVAFPISRVSSQPRGRTPVSCIAGRFFTSWATKEAQEYWSE